MDPSTSSPTIHLFTVEARDLPDNGKELTFMWQTSGGSEVMLICGNQRRFGKWWLVAAEGRLTTELYGTLYPNPPMLLSVKNAAGQVAELTVRVPWPCPDSFFFEPQPDMCPSGPPHFTAAAEQAFEQGWMIWLEQILPDDPDYTGWILSFHRDGSWRRYYDTWHEEQPASDPAIIPPSGYYQPVRGFGKTWREITEVRERMGWATEPEHGYEAAWQWRTVESLPSVTFLRMSDECIVQMEGDGSGTWQWVA
jgi:hypothetical protein